MATKIASCAQKYIPNTIYRLQSYVLMVFKFTVVIPSPNLNHVRISLFPYIKILHVKCTNWNPEDILQSHDFSSMCSTRKNFMLNSE